MHAKRLKWLKRLSGPENPGLRLVCFPHAGAGVSAFRSWPALVPADIEIWGVQLPGRENRFLEPPLKSMPPIIASVAVEMRQMSDMPVAFFGHSMGSLIAFETARLLRQSAGVQPMALLVSGNRPPHLQEQGVKTHTLPDKDFLLALESMNGIPPEILNNPELLELLIPVLRADLSVCQTYLYAPAEPLACPIVAFGGRDDPQACPELLAEWGAHTTAGFRTQILPGGHFYLQTSESLFLEKLSAELRAAATMQEKCV